jgi:predicted short-subunit dehydrogenase-like oxidoreductase (DUF2520 family)
MCAAEAGYSIVISGRNRMKCEEAAARINRASSPEAVLALTDMADAATQASIVLLTVSDNEIEMLCKELSDKGAFVNGPIVAHTSGALSSSVLSSAKRDCVYKAASAHPLQTFAAAECARKDLSGTHWFLEGDTEAVEELTKMVLALGGKPNLITSEQKPLYHAASVVASNYLASLIDVALRIMETASIDRTTSLAALQPLIKSTIDNALEIGPEHALTGPISRGDTVTLQHHLNALKSTPSFENIYRSVALHTVTLALRKGSINDRQADELLAILSN